MTNEVNEWVLRIVANSDTNAFKCLFNHYHERLHQMAHYYVKNEEDSKEIAADVFINFWKNRRNHKAIKKIDKYLFTSVKNRSIDYLRNGNKGKTVSIDSIEERKFTSNTNPEVKILYKEFESVVKATIDSLPERRKLIFKLVKEENLKYKEVGDLLDISTKTVEFHMGQAFLDIRNGLRDYLSSKDIRDHINRLALISLFTAPWLINIFY